MPWQKDKNCPNPAHYNLRVFCVNNCMQTDEREHSLHLLLALSSSLLLSVLLPASQKAVRATRQCPTNQVCHLLLKTHRAPAHLSGFPTGVLTGQIGESQEEVKSGLSPFCLFTGFKTEYSQIRLYRISLTPPISSLECSCPSSRNCG